MIAPLYPISFRRPAVVAFAIWLLVSCTAGKENDIALNDFRLKTLEGEEVDLGKYRGKRVFINVWATWCKPCVQEMPTIAEAMKQLEGEDMVFLFASNEDAEEIVSFRERRAFPFSYVQLLNLEALSIQALPTTFIFDEQGNLVYGEEGFRDWSTPENMEKIKPSVE